MKSAAIIGTREPAVWQISYASRLAMMLSYDHGVTIATGAADGIDKAAMDATMPPSLHVYLPWATYNRSSIPAGARIVVADPVKHAAWFASVDQYHPNPRALTRGPRALHARNYGIVHGRDLVIAFPGDRGGGGTGQGLRIAAGEHIPSLAYNRDIEPPSFDMVLKTVLETLNLH